VESARPAVSSIAEHPKSVGISAAFLLFSCLLSAFVAFAGGYWIGKNAGLAGLLPPAPAPLAAPAPAITDEPAISTPEPAETPAPEAADVAPASPQEAVLRAFLSAPGWASRILHVLAPERVREAMAAHAAAHGDGPIRFDGVSLLQESGNTRIFLVRTAAIPEGFPVVVAGNDTGEGWLVDWESFIEFHDDAFRQFADQGAIGQASFHLLVKPVDAKSGDDGVVKYRLNPPMSGRERVARIEDGSSTHAHLGEIFEAQAKLDPASYRELVASTGLPLVVAVSKRPTVGGGTKLWIERVEAVGWAPRMDADEH
jgi:hypothetical protein